MTTYFKDFNKECKDLLTKNYQQVDSWQVETKAKGPNKTLYVNPQANNHGVSVDIQLDCKECGFKTKTRVDSKGNVKPKVTYDKNGHKAEVSVNRDLKYELTYEAKFGKLAIADKLTNNEADAAFAFAVAPHCTVGGSIAYSIAKGSLHWAAGARYATGGYLFDVLTHDLKTYTTGVHAPLNIAGKKAGVAAQVVCGKGDCHFKVGTEVALCSCTTAKFHIDNKCKYAVSFIAKLSKQWKAIVTVDSAFKYGVLFQNE